MTMLLITGLTAFLFYNLFMSQVNNVASPRISPRNDSHVSGIPSTWLEVFVPPEGEDVDSLVYRVRVEADWSTVLGVYEHEKDDNFEEYLKSSGVSPFFISIILDTKPIMTIKKVFPDDDYYYDIDYYVIKDRDNVYGDVPEEADFQMVIKTETWVRDLEMRFRLGQAFTFYEADGSESENTFWFVEPRVLLLDKFRNNANHRIIYQFGETGFNTTIVDFSKNITAKRYFKRIEKSPGRKMAFGLEDSNTETQSVDIVRLEDETEENQMLSSNRQEVVLTQGNSTENSFTFQENGEGKLGENVTSNTENGRDMETGETHKERVSASDENADVVNLPEETGKENNNNTTNGDSNDKLPPMLEANFDFENTTNVEKEIVNSTLEFLVKERGTLQLLNETMDLDNRNDSISFSTTEAGLDLTDEALNVTDTLPAISDDPFNMTDIVTTVADELEITTEGLA